MSRRVGAGLAAVAGLAAAFAGCGDDEAGGPGEGSGLPAAVECGTQYRPDAERMTGAEEPVLRVERSDGLAGSTGSLEFETMTLSVTYVAEAPEGRSVDLTVVSAAGEPLLRALYQIGDPPLEDIRFAGGHGFTGLHYVDHEGAQLQVWCEAVDR